VKLLDSGGCQCVELILVGRIQFYSRFAKTELVHRLWHCLDECFVAWLASMYMRTRMTYDASALLVAFGGNHEVSARSVCPLALLQISREHMMRAL